MCSVRFYLKPWIKHNLLKFLSSACLFFSRNIRHIIFFFFFRLFRSISFLLSFASLLLDFSFRSSAIILISFSSCFVSFLSTWNSHSHDFYIPLHMRFLTITTTTTKLALVCLNRQRKSQLFASLISSSMILTVQKCLFTEVRT